MGSESTRARASDLPSLERLLGASSIAPLIERCGRSQVLTALRGELDRLRSRALSGELPRDSLDADVIAGAVERHLIAAGQPRLRPVFNLTGTVLHTNLGRALLPDEAVQAVVRASAAPVNLEFDLAGGGRGDRDGIVEQFICELTGAEAATVVNNNAAAVLLLLNTLANRREVIVSRGELVEIGGAFRIPDVMRSAGAKLVEVGTTNRTHAHDYADAIGVRSALVMKVHTSNYAISGFTASVDTAELAAIAHASGLPLAVDLGSGSLVDFTAFGLPPEPIVRDVIAAGADPVAVSGGQLPGGPPAGALLGRAAPLPKLKKNPLKRALRVGKLTLAALEAVLALYRAPEFLAGKVPTLRLLTRPAATIEAQASRLLPIVQTALGERYEIAVAPMQSQIGSGALPLERLPSFGFAISARKAPRGSLDRLDAALRGSPRPILGRIADKTLWLDLRCLEAADEAEFVAQWSRLDA